LPCIDTNVVSELRRPPPISQVIEWIKKVDDKDLFLSAVTVGAIQAGIELTRAQDADKAAELEQWLEQLATTYNVLPMDGKCFRRWAKLMHRQSNTVYEDAMIAATALEHDLAVVTRNTRDFARFQVRVVNPFK
jgi:predicted nucleic acid-binding protein